MTSVFVLLLAGCAVGSGEQALVDRIDENPQLLEFLPSDFPDGSSVVGLNVATLASGEIGEVAMTVAVNDTDIVAICVADATVSSSTQTQSCSLEDGSEQIVPRDERDLIVVVECASESTSRSCSQSVLEDVSLRFGTASPTRSDVIPFLRS